MSVVLVAPPLILLLLAAAACAWLARGDSTRRPPGGGQRGTSAGARDGVVAPWPERPATGTLVAADLGHAPSDRKEYEVSAFSAATIDDNLTMTAGGYEQLSAELAALQSDGRAAITEQLRQAREDGDPENPILFDLLEAQAQLESRISLLEAQLSAARVVTPASNGTAGIGSCVRVRHSDSGNVAEYDLVGTIESDVGNRRVSVGAPVGRALFGRVGGDTVVVETPGGPRQLEILAVTPGAGRQRAPVITRAKR